MDYNVESAKVDIEFTQGDTIDFSYQVFLNSIAYDLTGLQIDMKVRAKDYLLIKTFSTVTGEITVVTSTYNVYAVGFLDPGFYDYDIQLITVGGDIKTFQRGSIHVIKQYTT
jgi:hypothetical protein